MNGRKSTLGNVVLPETGIREHACHLFATSSVNFGFLILLILVNVSNSLGVYIQSMVFALGLICLKRYWVFRYNKLALISVVYLSACVVFAFVGGNDDFELQALYRSAKIFVFILMLFVEWRSLPDVFVFNSVKPWYLRSYLFLCTLNFIMAIPLGAELMRAQVLIEFTIYASYTISLLYFWDYFRLSFFDKVWAFVIAFMLGSTMGIFVLVCAEILGSIRFFTRARLLSLALLSPPMIAVASYLLTKREKEVSLQYLRDSDRGMLLEATTNWMLSAFNLGDWLMGYGPGKLLSGYSVLEAGAGGFGNWLMQFQGGGFFSYGVHNEFFRLIIDYGLLGVLFVMLLVSKAGRYVCILLFIMFTTNSYIYSFGGALVVAFCCNSIGPVRGHLGKPTR